MIKRKFNIPQCLHRTNNNKCFINDEIDFCACSCNRLAVSEEDNTPFQLMGKDISSVRNSILRAQGGVCKVCGVNLIGDSAACLDHHHQRKNKGTGQIRGVLCRTCNLMVAKNENNATRYRIAQDRLPEILCKIAEYLRSPQFPYMHPSEKPKVKKLTKLSYNRLKKKMDAFGKTKCPAYPKSGKLTVGLEKCFTFYKIIPEYYK